MRKDVPFEPVAAARKILRQSRTGGLATLSKTGAPYASLIILATAPDGAPLLLLSDLAVHTKNLERDPRVSLLLEERTSGDPMMGSRISVDGRAVKLDGDTLDVRRRFLARQPEAELYADFTDFSYWRIDVATVHLVAGFGRIVDIPADRFLLAAEARRALEEAEVEILEHLSADHRATLPLYARALLGLPEGDWRAVGIDADGLDLAVDSPTGLRLARLAFPRPVTSTEELRACLKELADAARQRPQA